MLRIGPRFADAPLALIPDDAVMIGRPREPLETVLKRERLFRLNSLIAQDVSAAA